MQRTSIRFAESVSNTPLKLRQASAALLPPLPYDVLIVKYHKTYGIAEQSILDSTAISCAHIDFFRVKCVHSEMTTSNQVRSHDIREFRKLHGLECVRIPEA